MHEAQASGGDGSSAGTREKTSTSSRGELRDGQAEMKHMMRRLSQLEVVAEENQRLQEQLNWYRQQPTMQPVIHVTTPPPAPRLKVFTGLPPTGGNEAVFEVWEEQTAQLVAEGGAGVDLQVKGTLKGLAYQQIRSLSSASDILARIREVFGAVMNADDLYMAFCETKMDKKESPSQFLIRLWDKLMKINMTTQFSDQEQCMKLYRVFTKTLTQTHPLLCLEVRNKFGFPGTAAPKLDELLRAVKQLEGEGSTTATPVRGATSHSQTLSDQDIDKIVNKVAEKLKTDISVKEQKHLPVSGEAAPTPPRRPPKGPCFRCGMIGHYVRQCRNTPNPERVAREKEKARQGQLNYLQSLAWSDQ